MIVYHGTNADFTEFFKSFMRDGRLGKRFYFTTSKEEAKQYGKNIVEAYLKIDQLYNGRKMKTTGKGKNFGIEYTISGGGGRVFMVNNAPQIQIENKTWFSKSKN